MIYTKFNYDIDLINEEDSSSTDEKVYIVNTKIILHLLSKPASTKALIEATGTSSHLTLLCIDRLLKNNVIRVNSTSINNGVLENSYELVSTDFNIISKYVKYKDSKKDIAKEITANNIIELGRTIINNSFENPDLPNVIKGTFIKINPNEVKNFIEEVNELIKKYENMEDLTVKEVFGFINVLGIYSL